MLLSQKGQLQVAQQMAAEQQMHVREQQMGTRLAQLSQMTSGAQQVTTMLPPRTTVTPPRAPVAATSTADSLLASAGYSGDCTPTERAWSGAPGGPVMLGALRIRDDARPQRPKGAPDVGWVAPGTLGLGINADAAAGFPQMRGYDPRYTLKAERDKPGEVMRPLGRSPLDANAVNGYRLGWQSRSYKVSDTVVREIDPAIQLDNLRKNPLAGALPYIQSTNAVFADTMCHTGAFCAGGERFCQ